MRNKFRKFLEILKSANWKTDTIIIAIFTIIMLGIINFDRVKYWIKEYDFMQLIAGIIAGLITWWAMWFIDLQNSKRWLTEAYAIEEAKSTIEYKLAFEQLFKGSLGSIPDCFIYSPNDFYLKITAIQQLNKRIHNYNEKLVHAIPYLQKHNMIDTIIDVNNGLFGKLKKEIYDCNIKGLLTLDDKNDFETDVSDDELIRMNSIIKIIIDLNKDEIFNKTITSISDFLNSKVLSHY